MYRKRTPMSIVHWSASTKILKENWCFQRCKKIRSKLRHHQKTIWWEGKLNVTHTRACKLVFVTNSWDWSDDYLVSDKQFKLIGESVVSFREKLIESETATSLLAVVKHLIPPKGGCCEMVDFSQRDQT